MSNVLFDWPVGLPNERGQRDRLPGAWFNATGYGQRYDATGKWAIHTGLDLNLPGNQDAHAQVYAPADGQIQHAAHLPVWGMVITISHAGGLWTRLAHGEACSVIYRQWVKRGDPVCRVGNADNRYPYHLHYDIARIDLGKRPADWPGDDPARVTRDYLNPIEFMKQSFDPDPTSGLQAIAQPQPAGDCLKVMQVSAVPNVRVRSGPALDQTVIARLDYMSRVCVVEQSPDRLWYRISLPIAGWVSAQWLQEAGS